MRPKGSEKTPGSGRRAGSTNKTTRDLKEMILGALHRAGGEDWLLEQMNANPVAFMTLIGKILPLQVTGKDGGPLEHRHMDVPKEERAGRAPGRRLGLHQVAFCLARRRRMYSAMTAL
jgi:hypothetical protein